MPLVRISLPAGKDAGFVKGVSDAVQDAMVANIDVPAADRFHVFGEHAPERLIIDPTYLGVERGAGALIVEITMRGGRSVEKKKALYRAIAENWALIAGGFGFASVAAKIERVKDKPVREIAEEALHR